MSKKLECDKCFTYLGEMEKGKIKNGSVILCSKCIDFYKTCHSFSEFNKPTFGSTPPFDTPDIFKDIMDGKFG